VWVGTASCLLLAAAAAIIAGVITSYKVTLGLQQTFALNQQDLHHHFDEEKSFYFPPANNRL